LAFCVFNKQRTNYKLGSELAVVDQVLFQSY